MFNDTVAQTELIGPPNPIVRRELQTIRAKGQSVTDADRARIAELEAKEDVRIPFTIRWNRSGREGPERGATIEIAGQSIRLKQGEWSRWINLDFRVNLFVRLHGMAQMYSMAAGPERSLISRRSTGNLTRRRSRSRHPHPSRNNSTSASAHIARLDGRKRHGRSMKAEWTKRFMEDLHRAFEDRAQVILSRLDSRDWDLLVGVIESTDRVQHMMWRLTDPKHPMHDAKLAARFGDSIERIYRAVRQPFIAEVLERLEPGIPVLIVSDHGFHSWRKAVNLNTWLVQQGYMALQGQVPGEKKLDDLFGGGEFWENVDWSRTKAYAMGLGQIYFNLRGREAKGIVGAGAEYKQLADELSAALLTMKDPEDGSPIVRAVYKRDDVRRGVSS